MKVKNPDLLIDMHAEATRCENDTTEEHDGPLEIHHIFCRGMGGGSRLDIPWNLIALCKKCHMLAHEKKIERRLLLGIASEREIWKMERS